MLKCIRGSVILKYVEFKNGLESGDCFPVYLFEGEDAFFRERGFLLLKNRYLLEPELNLTVLNPDCTVDKLISSLSGYPFMSEKRITVIREFYPKQEFMSSGLKDYLDNPFEYGILVILNEKPCETLKKYSSVCVVDCNKADVTLLIRWIKAECINNGVNIDGETAKTLAEYCLLDMSRIENETKKLCAYVGQGGEISINTLDEMVARDNEYKIYEMTDYIAKKKFDLALSVIKDMLSKGETPQRILTAVYNYFRRLLHSAISDLEIEELAKCLDIKPFAVKKAREQAQKFKKKALKSAVDELTEVDYKIKSGLADADERMWLTVFKILTDNYEVKV